MHLIITGTVQGVYYRKWTATAASARGLSGWVRNRRDGSVEAVLAGPSEPLEAMISDCWQGPSAALVADVTVSEWAAEVAPGFQQLATL